MRSYNAREVLESDTLRAIRNAHQDWVITWEDDDLLKLDFIRIGHVKGKPGVALICDKGQVFEMPEKQWEKERFSRNGKDKYGKKVCSVR